MRIALIAPLFESVPPKLYGGTERVVYNLCRGLSEAGQDVTLFASGDSDVPCQVVPSIERAIRLSDSPIRDAVPYYLKLLAEVARRADDFDVIHNHHDYWSLPLCRMTDTPLVSTAHGRMDLPGLGIAFENYANASMVSISDAQRAPLPSLNWVRTVHHGLDIPSFQFHEKPGKYLAFLGRISPEKRPDWAIDIAIQSGVPLKIAAKIEGAADQEFFESEVRHRIDGKFIEFVGEISESEKSDFLGNALALAFPIDWPEPFGLVMVESLACGTPVLARPCGSVPEVLRDGVTGFVDLSVQKLASRVADLGQISRFQCRRWAEEHFSLQRMTKDYLDVYGKITGGISRRRRDFLHSVQLAADRNS